MTDNTPNITKPSQGESLEEFKKAFGILPIKELKETLREKLLNIKELKKALKVRQSTIKRA